ncbi:MAG: PEP-CTERM sorting domain-containing protein [Azoarcus sp.]|nr:PEP-CTERM sorting domain-containing protein [Azoarcus sp.]
MNPILRICNTAVAPAIAALLLGAAGSAQATFVTIDPAQSSVTYTFGGMVLCDPDGNCPEPPASQTFALSGSFEVERTTAFITDSFYPPSGHYRDAIRFQSVSVDGGGATQMGFSFPTYLAIEEGGVFSGSEDPCTPAMGPCLAGQFGWFSAEFDGHTLMLSGIDFADSGFFSDRFAFTVFAYATAPASVPEPGTLACLAAGMLGLGAVRKARARTAS